MKPEEMAVLRDQVVAAPMAWWHVPDTPRGRWCELAQGFEEAACDLADACAALDAAQTGEP